jgi:dTDP-glucose pyrophosphorylase
MNIVIPMAGLGSRFSKVGFQKPKPFIDILSKPMIVRVLENLKIPDAKYFLIARKEHLEIEKDLVNYISNKYNVKFIGIDKLTEGTACTVLYARKYINNEDPLLIANSDQIVDFSVIDYVSDCLIKKLDGSILVFNDLDKDPKWSFAKVDNNGLVIEVQEKNPISNLATVGLYFFTKGQDFVNNALDMIIENNRVNNEFYTCPVYNYLINNQKKVGVFEIEKKDMHCVGTPEDLKIYIDFLEKNN